MDKLYTVDEIAAFLSLEKKTIQNWISNIRRGKSPASLLPRITWVGSHARFDQKDVEEWKNSQKMRFSGKKRAA